MKIVVDIGHPAHVHLFKNFIWEMQKRGHEILITATRKDISMELLDNYGFSYVAMGSYGSSMLKKVVNVPIMDLKMYKAVKSFKPDILIGVSPIRAAHVSRLIRKPCIAFDDTEHSKCEHRLYTSFVDSILTPSCFKKDLGKKQVRYNGYHELAYLHPNYFKPDPSVLGELGLSEGERFIVVRFVSWGAIHDIQQRGFVKPKEVISRLESYGRILITSEEKLDAGLEKYRITVSPERLHDLLYYAMLYIGEGATIATEAAILGTPSLYISSLSGTMGNFEELESKYDLVYSFRDQEDAVNKATQLLQVADSKERWAKKREGLLADKIDVTQFMVDFIENYPESLRSYKDKGVVTSKSA